MNREPEEEMNKRASDVGVPTKRSVSSAMEEEMFQVRSVLDHGMVRLVGYMGDERDICASARVSYGAGTKLRSEDRNLIRYMVRHAHTSPLEQCEVRLHLKLPIFVARQLIRHRTASLNEVSGRYSILPSEFYVPELSRIQRQSTTNKQGSGEAFHPGEACEIQSNIRAMALDEFKHYSWMNECGVSRELSRINLPLSTYTEMYWKIDLHNLLHFLSLRMDSHSQYEIRAYADEIGEIVSKWVPVVWEAFNDYHPRRGAHTFSAPEMRLLKALIRGGGDLGRPEMKGLAATYGIGSMRERKAFWKATGLLGDGGDR